jgi:glucan endo-1,3-alpha-glucosidase
LPEYVQIITWNDFGESSYIAEPVPAQIVSGAEVYVDGFDHSAFRFVLPYFVVAYIAGKADVPLLSEGALAWYRTTPGAICGDGGIVWGQGGSTSAAAGTSDVISVIALSDSARDITVSVSGSPQTVSPVDSVGKAYFYQVPFSGKSGDVTVTVNGKTATGPAILDVCPASGHVRFSIFYSGLILLMN